LPTSPSLPEIDNSQWTSYKKLWSRLKIVRNEWSRMEDEKIKKMLKEEEIEICEKLVKIAPYLSDGKGKRITVPAFPLVMGTKR
jgi:hypothetical protein